MSTLFRLLYECSQLGLGLCQLLLRRGPRLSVDLPELEEGGVWIHSVSVGEVRAVRPLVDRLKKECPNLQFILSIGTKTGLAEAERLFPDAAAQFLLPLDLSPLIRPLVRRIRPGLVIVTETDFWFNFLDEASRIGAKIVVVNGKISERSARRQIKRLLAPIDHFCLQDRVYEERFLQLGIEPGRLTVTGNIKLDMKLQPMSASELAAFRAELKLPDGVPVVVLGSTHDPEERQLIDQLRSIHPDLRILVVPRHPERFDEVASLCDGRYSQGLRGGEERLLLIDQMGMLTRCYQLADVALVAGSWTERVGGHNVLEPIQFDVPVLFGPHMQAQPTFEKMVLEARAGEQVEMERVGKRVAELLEERADLVEGAKQLRTSMGGAVERTLPFLLARKEGA